MGTDWYDILQRDVYRVTWHVPLQTLASSAQPPQNGAGKTAFKRETFLSPKQRTFHPLLTGDLR